MNYSTNKGAVKVVDYSLLPYLNDITLAYWAMDDGAAARDRGFYLHTQIRRSIQLCCTTYLNLTALYKTTKTVLLRAESMLHFVNQVKSHFHPLMLYKLPKSR
jgi:hypothetical protein